MNVLCKASIRLTASASGHDDPTCRHPELLATLVGPTSPDGRLTWTVWRPDGQCWFEQATTIPELDDAQLYPVRLRPPESACDVDLDGSFAFTLRLVNELDEIDELLYDDAFVSSVQGDRPPRTVTALDWGVEALCAPRNEHADAPIADLDEATLTALQRFVDRSELLLSTWEPDMSETLDLAGMSRAERHELRLRRDVLEQELVEFEEVASAVRTIPHTCGIEVLGGASTVEVVTARVRALGEYARGHIQAVQDLDERRSRPTWLS